MRHRTLPFLRLRSLIFSLAAIGSFAPAAFAADPGVTVSHGFAIHGDIKYPPDFKNYDYVNPNAPKGGDVKLAARGTFDNLNPFILRGVPAATAARIYEGIMTRSADEPATDYCQICETIELPKDRSWVIFNLRPQARFHDGKPITADDVVWTFETLKTKGHPMYRSYYASVAKAEKLGDHKVKFTFQGDENRELPGIIGEMPVLPKHYWADKDFEKTTLEPPLGSGPYKIDSLEPGRFIVVKRVPDYWGANLPVNVGLNNFDTIRVDYYRDDVVSLEAFKAGEYDMRQENSAKNWATAYDIPAVQNGLIKREVIPDTNERVMQGYAMNMRRDMFKDRRVREAMIYAFDFEWMNKNLFYGFYHRIDSYFGREELSARGLPKGEELKVLERFRDKLPPELFTTEYKMPKTDGTGNWRDNQRVATRLLREAGWRIVDQKLVDAQGKQMEFEILIDQPAFERITLPYVDNLKRLGINARVRTVDTSQFQRRSDDFDYDMLNYIVAQSESPGNEQRDYWSSKAAATQGSRNAAGISDPVVDQLIDLVISAPDRDTLVARTEALDRVLLWGHYIVPHFRLYADWVASWDRFGHPEVNPKVGYYPTAWWVDPQKDAALRAKRGQAPR
jgi:microcin C transport system substrate-binding protein